MLIPSKFNGYVGGRRTCHTGMEPLLIGAALGGGSQALQGGDFEDILKGAVLGGVTGGIGNAAFQALPGIFGAAAPAAGELASVGAAAPSAAQFATPSLFGEAAQGLPSLLADPNAASALYGQTGSSLSAAGQSALSPYGKVGFMDSPTQWWKSLSPEKRLMYGGAGGLGALSLMNQQNTIPQQEPYAGPLSRFQFNPDTYRPAFAGGGLTDIYVGDQSSARPMARGGIADLGSYSDGGRLLKGPGDGMSDNIPATISNKRPARLADGEFVVPADVVSHLGNGSTDAGAKQLYKMMDRVRSARTGRKAQGKQIRAPKFMPA